jgi:hypothetical protein
MTSPDIHEKEWEDTLVTDPYKRAFNAIETIVNDEEMCLFSLKENIKNIISGTIWQLRRAYKQE